MEVKAKRKRSQNFTDEECTYFVNLIKKYEVVVENKKTDFMTAKEKDACWQKIETSFNSMTGGVHRNSKELRLKYDNLTKVLKGKIANNRREQGKTGAGTANIIKLNNYEETIYGMIKLSVDGLPSIFDNDMHASSGEATASHSVATAEDTLTQSPASEIDISILTTQDSSILYQNYHNWRHWNPQALKRPISNILKPAESCTENSPISQRQSATPEIEHEDQNEKTDIPQTAPKKIIRKTIPKLPTNNTRQLVDSKLELIKIQIKYYEKLNNELDEKSLKRKTKHELLKTDLKIRKLELQKLEEETFNRY